MAKHKKVVGAGITKLKGKSYSGEDMAAAFDDFACQWNAALREGGGSFRARVQKWERVCRNILTEAGPVPFDADDAKDYARRILRLIDMTMGHITRGDADEAARVAVDVGRLCAEAYMKEGWEKHALRGEANAARLKEFTGRANVKRQVDAQSLHATWQAMADEKWVKNKHLSKHAVAISIAKETGDNFNTIRRIIIKPR